MTPNPTITKEQALRTTRSYNEKHALFNKTLHDALPTVTRHRAGAKAAADERLMAARKELDRMRALVKIGKKTEADVAAAQKAFDDLRYVIGHGVAVEIRARRREAKFQLPVLEQDVKDARRAVIEAHRSLVSDDVRELRRLLTQALTVNARLAATESSLESHSTHRVWRARRLPAEAVGRLEKWAQAADDFLNGKPE